jgi:tRNA A-37 threonylcarbamoyl transferase component Bud32
MAEPVWIRHTMESSSLSITSSTRLLRVRIGGRFWRVREGALNDRLRGILVDPDGRLASAVHRFKHSRNVTIARVSERSAREPGLVLRRMNYGRFGLRLRDTFRRSRAQRALRMALRLEASGIAVARGIAAADVRCCWRWPLRAFLVTEEVREARTLADLGRARQPPPRGWVDQLAGLLGRMHAAGFSHRDLKANNVLFNDCGEPVLIDLDGVKCFRTVSQTRAAKDLARLRAGLGSIPWLRSRVWIGFLQTYAAARGQEDWRDWFRAIEGVWGRY